MWGKCEAESLKTQHDVVETSLSRDIPRPWRLYFEAMTALYFASAPTVC